MGRMTYAETPHVEALLNADPATRLVALEYARKALVFAREAHPVHSGRGMRALDVYDVPGHKPALITHSPFWHWVEFGNVHIPPYAPMRRGVEGSGCKYVDVRGGSEGLL